MPRSIQVARLEPHHAQDAARLHIAGQLGTFLTALGAEVLTVIYRALPQSPAGFGVVALDALSSPSKLLGFASATTSTGALFANVLLQDGGELIPALLRAAIREPSLVGRIVRTALYPLQTAYNDGARTGELLSIMVEPALRGTGVGSAMLAALIAQCQHRRVEMLEVTVDAANPGARRFYARHGFVVEKEFTLYGREMCQYVGAVPAPLDGAGLFAPSAHCVQTGALPPNVPQGGLHR